MMHITKLIVAIWFFLISSVANAQESGTVILVVDISSSISNEQMYLQMGSYASVLDTVASVRSRRIVSIVFSTTPEIISNGSYQDAIAAFNSYPILDLEHRGQTCLSTALLAVEDLLPTLPRPIVIDISGDGEANCEGLGTIPSILDRMVSNFDVQVNTLYIENNLLDHVMGLRGYDFYETLVRNDGFIMNATSFMDFEFSLFEKLTLEISWLDQR